MTRQRFDNYIAYACIVGLVTATAIYLAAVCTAPQPAAIVETVGTKVLASDPAATTEPTPTLEPSATPTAVVLGPGRPHPTVTPWAYATVTPTATPSPTTFVPLFILTPPVHSPAQVPTP